MRLGFVLLAFAGAAAGQLTDANPPSTLLPPDTRSIDFSVRSAEPASCAYSVGAELPYAKMIPFARGQGTTEHGTAIAGLDPDTTRVNEVWVRCAPRPADALHLRYRSLPPANAPFPRAGNLWGTGQILPGGLPHAARISLHLGANFKPDQIRQLRALNPNILILTSINTVENANLPDDFYLKDTNGKRIEVWPNIYRLNLTKPKVAEYQARFAYERILKLDLMVDGCFFDNFFTTQAWLKADIHGNAVQLDADEDGRPDDPKTLDRKWRQGVFDELRAWRKLMPHALASGHLFRPADQETMEIFNGDSIGFMTARVLEGERPFSGLWDVYHGWFQRGRKPVLMMIESAPHNQIAYGYDYRPLDKIPPSTLEFARTYFPFVRFGLALTLMNDGYFAHEFGDTWHGNDWWYDELDFNLGQPQGEAKPAAPGVWRRDFTHGIALLNGSNQRQTVKPGAGFRRLIGSQAARHEFIVDDTAPAFSFQGGWREVVYDSGRWKSKGPFFHHWGKHAHQLDDAGSAEWKIETPGADTYTISAWWAAAPESKGWTTQAVYEVLSGGKVVATATLDQTKAGDEWHEIAKAPLAAGGGTVVRVRNAGAGALIADALYLRSASRYNDGSPAPEVTLEPLDGIVLERIDPRRVRVTFRETDAVFQNPGQGWMTGRRSEEPRFPASVTYFRLNWGDLEPEEGQPNWSLIDAPLEAAQKRGMRIAFRIMTTNAHSQGYYCSPKWLFDGGAKWFEYLRGGDDPTSGGRRIQRIEPDYADPLYLAKHGRFLAELGKRYDGHPGVEFLDVGSYGIWGEWHTSHPVSIDTRRKIVDLYLAAFRRTPLMMMSDDAEALAYALPKGAGFRRDGVGSPGHEKSWIGAPKYAGVPGFAEAWKKAPVVFEWYGNYEYLQSRKWSFDRAIQFMLDNHVTLINDNVGAVPPEEMPKLMKLARLAGYRFVLRELSHEPQVARGGRLPIRMTWSNVGVGRLYRQYFLELQLLDAAGRAVERTRAKADLRSWLPGDYRIEEELAVGPGVKPGTYRLALALVDPGGKPAIQLAIDAPHRDRVYTLSKVRVPAR